MRGSGEAERERRSLDTTTREDFEYGYLYLPRELDESGICEWP